MKFIADFHIHSRFSAATSSKLTPEILERWARIKGIGVLGTGDFTHPGWIAELKEKLVPAEEGLFVLSDEARQSAAGDPYVLGLPVPRPQSGDAGQEAMKTRFILTAEISTIYSAGGKVRKVHHVLLAPGFEEVERIRTSLGKIGNLAADGRPILGLDSRNLLEIVLAASPACVLIPAHIWTPWFSALGAKSGFDSIKEAYRDLAEHIFAVETGLSSDPAMNWLCGSLDSYAILSNSDAHSPENLGREANLFEAELSYPGVVEALKKAAEAGTKNEIVAASPEGFLGTYEFFPQEGKYHFDGHRKCGVRFTPGETAAAGGLCPKCGKALTVGVVNRVAELADRRDPLERKGRRDFRSLIPLKEILSELEGVGTSSKAVTARYNEVIRKGGTELNLLAELPLEEVRAAGGENLAEAVARMRERRVYVDEGYDGEYGLIRVFSPAERKGPRGRRKDLGLAFDPADSDPAAGVRPEVRPLLDFDPGADQGATATGRTAGAGETADSGKAGGEDLNPEQASAALHEGGPLLILAGPGTGKTKTLTRRIARLVEKGTSAESILAVTFTNKAAEEMRTRLETLLGPEAGARIAVRTFHAFGLEILKEHHDLLGRSAAFFLLGEEDRKRVLRDSLLPGLKAEGSLPAGATAASLAKDLSAYKQGVRGQEGGFLAGLAARYEEELRSIDAFDLDDLVPAASGILDREPPVLASLRNRFTQVLADEYQDVNAAQYRLLRLLAPGEDAKLTVVGDPNQAIYGFRGADPAYIRRFREDYPGAASVSLARSYRCPGPVLRAARAVVGSGGPEAGSNGARVKVARFATDASEAEFVARTVEDLAGGIRFFSLDSGVASGAEAGSGLGGIAVLVRSSRQLEALEKAFQDHAIPYVRAGEASKLAEGPAAKALSFAAYVFRPSSPYLRALAEEAFPGLPAELSEAALASLAGLAEAREFFPRLLDLLRSRLGGEADEVLKGFLSRSGRLAAADCLRAARLGTAQDDLAYRPEAVTLATIHAVKGLEFDQVFVTGCEDGLLPYSLFEDRPADPEEERRILYVGMTRAKKVLYLTSARRRSLYGKEYRLEESPFLAALGEENLERIKVEEKPRDPQLSLF